MAITILQSTNTGVNGPQAAFVQAYGSNITAGSLLVCAAWTFENATSTLTIADDRSQVWQTAVQSARGSPANSIVYIFYFLNAASGATTVTVSSSPNSVIGVHIFEVVITPSAALDATTSGTGTGTTINPGSLITTTANQLLFAAGAGGGGAPAGATSWTFHDSADYYYQGCQTRIVSATGTYPAAFAGAEGDYVGAAASFMESGGEEPPGPQPVIFTSIGV